MLGADQGQRDGLGGRGGVLQGQQRHRERGQRGECAPQHKVHRYWFRRAERSLWTNLAVLVLWDNLMDNRQSLDTQYNNIKLGHFNNIISYYTIMLYIIDRNL